MDKTDWFPAHIKPVHVGYYERKYSYFNVQDWWDGSVWRYTQDLYACSVQNKWWRGLTEKAE